MRYNIVQCRTISLILYISCVMWFFFLWNRMTDTKPASTDYVIYRKLLSMGMSCSNVIVKNLGPSSSYVQTWGFVVLSFTSGLHRVNLELLITTSWSPLSTFVSTSITTPEPAIYLKKKINGNFFLIVLEPGECQNVLTVDSVSREG